LRLAIDTGKTAEELVPTWEADSKPFEKLRAQFLIYR
jgi:hypothetical protein